MSVTRADVEKNCCSFFRFVDGEHRVRKLRRRRRRSSSSSIQR